MKVEEVVETQELLEMAYLPLFSRRAIYKTLARPYYFRWRSSVEGSVEVEGETIPSRERRSTSRCCCAARIRAGSLTWLLRHPGEDWRRVHVSVEITFVSPEDLGSAFDRTAYCLPSVLRPVTRDLGAMWCFPYRTQVPGMGRPVLDRLSPARSERGRVEMNRWGVINGGLRNLRLFHRLRYRVPARRSRSPFHGDLVSLVTELNLEHAGYPARHRLAFVLLFHFEETFIGQRLEGIVHPAGWQLAALVAVGALL